MKSFIIRLRDWYGKFERPLSSLSLIGGFLFDAITLKRLDLFWENIWVIAHFTVVIIFIILVNRQENEVMDEKDASKAHFWYINILQWFFGGLLSTFLVFYFRSTTLAVTWPFLLLLVVAFVANESLKKNYARLTFQIGLFFLSLLSFAIFIVPVLVHRIGTDIFLVSEVISLILLWLFLSALTFITKKKFQKGKRSLTALISSIFIIINILYFLNLIPPIPLSLKDGGVYHSLARDATGNYIVTSEHKGWLNFFTFHEDFHAVAGGPIYAYSAIFSPALFNTDIVHEWEHYDENTSQWISMGRVDLSVLGGRDEGYRTYSMKNDVAQGKWRVNVETPGGKIIGRLRFDVIPAIIEPSLETEIKN